jgi:hypothetical protein
MACGSCLHMFPVALLVIGIFIWMGVMVDKSMTVLYDYRYGIQQVKNDSGQWYSRISLKPSRKGISG